MPSFHAQLLITLRISLSLLALCWPIWAQAAAAYKCFTYDGIRYVDVPSSDPSVSCVPNDEVTAAKPSDRGAGPEKEHGQASAVDESYARMAHVIVLEKWAARLKTIGEVSKDPLYWVKPAYMPDPFFFRTIRSVESTILALSPEGAEKALETKNILERAESLKKFSEYIGHYEKPEQYTSPGGGNPNDPMAFPGLNNLGHYVYEQATAVKIAQSMTRASLPEAPMVAAMANDLNIKAD